MSTVDLTPDYDFIIIGARVAGAATARLLAHGGARVLVVERGKLGADTLSTSYLMRGAVVQLHRWGIVPALIAAGTPAVRTTHFHFASGTLPVDIRPAGDFNALYAPRRTLLDPLLVAAARAAGADVEFGTRVAGLAYREDGKVCGVELEAAPGHARRRRVTARMVIGADGLHSSLADWVGATPYRVGEHCAPTIYGYYEGLSVDAYHWYYVDGVAAGAAPTNDGLATVFVGGPVGSLPELHGDREAGLHRIASRVSTTFAETLRACRRVGALRAFPGVRGFYRKPYGPGWALVGDAGYFRDPNTAHGISDALRDSELLARALLGDTSSEAALEQYWHTRDAASERLFEAADELAGGAWDEPRVGLILRALSEGMRDGMRVVEAMAAHERDASAPALTNAHVVASNSSATQSRSYGAPTS